MSNLQPKQFFHASGVHNLEPGKDKIESANRVGGSNWGYSHHEHQDPAGSTWAPEPDGSNRGDWVFAADNEEEAEAWMPMSGGRDVTYVVDPGDRESHVEQHHTMVRGDHLKVRGEMDIVDRIDIPRPEHPGQVVQGTIGGEDWRQYDKRAPAHTPWKSPLGGLAGPFKVKDPIDGGTGVMDHINHVNYAPKAIATRREFSERSAQIGATVDRHQARQAWQAAGQQSFFRNPYDEEPEDWETGPLT